jgi:hypothetical protein
MRTFKIVLMGLCAAFVMFQCAGSGVKGLTPYGQFRVIEAEYNKVYDATKNYIFELGYRINKDDKQAGDIETEYRLGAGLNPPREETDEGRASVTSESRAFTGEKRARFRAKVERVDDLHTKLTLELLTEIREINGPWELITGDIRSARYTYDRYFEQIIARAQGRAATF